MGGERRGKKGLPFPPSRWPLTADPITAGKSVQLLNSPLPRAESRGLDLCVCVSLPLIFKYKKIEQRLLASSVKVCPLWVTRGTDGAGRGPSWPTLHRWAFLEETRALRRMLGWGNVTQSLSPGLEVV